MNGTWSGIMLGAAALLATACTDLAGDEGKRAASTEEERVAATEQRAISGNAISGNAISGNAISGNAISGNAISGNAISGNALGPTLQEVKDLTTGPLTDAQLNANAGLIASLNSTADSGIPNVTLGRLREDFLRYTYECAMPDESSMTLALSRGNVIFGGRHGLVPTWGATGGSCDTNCQRLVSACVLARVNGYRVRVRISLRGDAALPVTPEEAANYSIPEARYFGNLFSDELSKRAMACEDQGKIAHRSCAGISGNCPIDVVGSCQTSCTALDPTTNASTCTATLAGGGTVSLPALGVWLETPQCGDGVCQNGETGASCPYDCPATASTTTLETGTQTARPLVAAAQVGDNVVYAGITNQSSLAGLGSLNPPVVSARDLFVLQANANGTYAAAKRFAAPSSADDDPVSIDASGTSVVVASKNTMRLMAANTLTLTWTMVDATSTARFRFNRVKIAGSLIHALGTLETSTDGSTWTFSELQHRTYNASTGALSTTESQSTINTAWALWTPGNCYDYAARNYSSTQIRVNALGISTVSGCSAATNWTQDVTVSGIANPTPVAIRDGVFVAGTGTWNGRPASFLGRVYQGTNTWAWFNRLEPPTGGSVTITSMQVRGRLLVIGGQFQGVIDFRGQARSPRELRRPFLDDARSSVDTFVAAYDIDTGALRWTRDYGGPDNDTLDAFTLDNGGRLWTFASVYGRALLEGTYRSPLAGATDTDAVRIVAGPLPMSPPQAVAQGPTADHSLLVRRDGKVMAWGRNSSGQLGTGTTTDSNLPLEVPGMSGVVSVAAGALHSLALGGDGQVRSFGNNASGQLGSGTTTSRSTPGLVSGLTNVVAVAAGDSHSMALKADGTVWTWGKNASGQLGDGTTTSRLSPVQVPSLGSVVAISVGTNFSMALKADGTLWTWGNNPSGQLGNGTTTSRSSPVQVLADVTTMAAGDAHAMAVKNDGTLWTWGKNASGQLGDGTTTSRATPAQISGLTSVAALAAGNYHSLAQKADGTVWTWGDNDLGELGTGSAGASQLVPVNITSLANVSALAAGSHRSLSLLRTGDLKAWGWNGYGGLGDGSSVDRSQPVPVHGIPTFRIASGGDEFNPHALIVDESRGIWGWGSNLNGMMGDGTDVVSRRQPTLVRLSSLQMPVAVAIGSVHSLALLEDGTVYGWGTNYDGELLSNPEVNNMPTVLLSGGQAIAAGDSFSLVLKRDGTVWGFGGNSVGALGDGTTITRYVPVQVLKASDQTPLNQIVDVKAKWDGGVALDTAGHVWSWGRSCDGQGDGTPADCANRSLAVQVRTSDGQLLSNIVALTTTMTSNAALDASGHVWTWGSDYFGSLGGVSTSDFVLVAMQVPDPRITNIVQIAAGQSKVLALRSDGIAFASSPSGFDQVPLTGITAVGVTSDTYIAIGDGIVYTWGGNGQGSLGDNTDVGSRGTPAPVIRF